MLAVRLDWDGDGVVAVPLGHRASALRVLAGADGYITVPPGSGISAGAMVDVIPLRW